MSGVLSEQAARNAGAESTQRKTSGGTGAPQSVPVTSVHRVEADGVRIFYRSAGDAAAPVLLLLHGFPTSSFMFRDLIPRLADQYRVIAPDLPGFGFTEVPEVRKYAYSFDSMANTIGAFTDALGLNRYAIYVFDYGAPTGFRLAMRHPERVTAIISQNGNAYEEGLGDAWGPIRKYWSQPSTENRVLHTGCSFTGASRKQGDSARFVSGLRFERKALSEVSGVLSQSQAAFAGDLGQERPVLHPCWCRSLSKRPPERTSPAPGYGALCH